jgi:hypothetical protein
MLILLSLLIYQPAFSWILKNQDGKCADGGESFSPDGFLRSSMAECTKTAETKLKTVLNCKSRAEAMNGKIEFYASMEDCKLDGGKHDEIKASNIKEIWQKNYKSKLWSISLFTCPHKKIVKCYLNKIVTSEYIETIGSGLEAQGYNCSSTFDTILNSKTPSGDFKMSHMCLRTSDLCSMSTFFYESENDCKVSEKQWIADGYKK